MQNFIQNVKTSPLHRCSSITTLQKHWSVPTLWRVNQMRIIRCCTVKDVKASGYVLLSTSSLQDRLPIRGDHLYLGNELTGVTSALLFTPARELLSLSSLALRQQCYKAAVETEQVLSNIQLQCWRCWGQAGVLREPLHGSEKQALQFLLFFICGLHFLLSFKPEWSSNKLLLTITASRIVCFSDTLLCVRKHLMLSWHTVREIYIISFFKSRLKWIICMHQWALLEF